MMKSPIFASPLALAQSFQCSNIHTNSGFVILNRSYYNKKSLKCKLLLFTAHKEKHFSVQRGLRPSKRSILDPSAWVGHTCPKNSPSNGGEGRREKFELGLRMNHRFVDLVNLFLTNDALSFMFTCHKTEQNDGKTFVLLS